MSAVANRNVATGFAVRQLVARYLVSEGLNAVAKPHHTKISTGIEDGFLCDVSGIPNVWLDVTSRLTHRLAIDLDAARRGADLAGVDIAAYVQHRGGRGVDEAYVVSSLADFAKLARGDHLKT